MAEEELSIQVEFTGGLELLFSNQRKHTVKLFGVDDHGRPANMATLIEHLCEKVANIGRQDMFILDGSIPGVLVLINDADWELEGGDQYELKANDNILFVSTLHGG